MPIPARVVHPSVLKQTEPIEVNWEDFERHYLAEGDSWFSLAALPGGNLLQELELGRSALVVDCAAPGDTLTHIVEWSSSPQFTNLFATRLAEKWDALLVSAGGNDLIDAALASPGILRQIEPGADVAAGDCVDAAAFAKLERYLRANFAELVKLRDSARSPNKGVPIIIHTYDFATPRPAPALALGLLPASGPWLCKAFEQHGIPKALWVDIADDLQQRLASILRSLDLPGVFVVDTLGTLARAALGSAGDSADWLNEIHPNRGGRRKLAQRWAAALDAL